MYYTLHYSSSENGHISGDTLQTVEEFQDGTPVEAVPNRGYHFVEWSDGVIDNPRTDRYAESDISVAALFEKDVVLYYTLHYSSSENGHISGDTLQTVEEFQDGTSVEAVPNSGFYFIEWSDGVTDNPRTDLQVENDVSVQAIFDISTEVRNNLLRNIQVYPNPVGNILHIANPGISSFGYRLSQVDGRVLKEGKIESAFAALILDEYASGIYILSFSNNDSISSVKLIKK